jgi:hypothetical protein
MKIYVSLTSIFDKQICLLQSLKSIISQSTLPEKCFIYLSEEPYLLDKGFKNKEINKELIEFVNSHELFEIRWVDNIGPYRKLLFLLKEKWDEDCLILTIDDDIIYNNNLIKDYIADYNIHKCCISYRGGTLNFKNKDFSDCVYEKRKSPILRHAKYNFANSGVGMVTHPSFFHKTSNLIFNLDIINEVCNTGDDIWYYFCRIANNIDTVIINKPTYFKLFTNYTALYYNYNKKQNTTNIQKTAAKFIEMELL